MNVLTQASEARFRDPDRKRDPPLPVNSGAYLPPVPTCFISNSLMSKGVKPKTRQAFRMPSFRQRRCGAMCQV